MRLIHVFLVVVAALVASSNAVPASADISQLTSEQNKRSLRGRQAVVHSDGEKEERRLVNVDLAIKDAVKATNKATVWKAQCAAWKLMGKTPTKLAQELKIMNRGHVKWEKFMAYQKFYGKGPLRYP
ncbi:Avr1b-1 avirulence-like protein [Phytophthora sojae]|uniref:RxLR effector protein n=2 Tax=Phytophthora sojae TaxID=67593 RepID=G4YE58_PHYSP|nr:Avr1b-1 avirulence-like protein [Phytophthora sojae]AEK80594.1 Avh66 [Phytophthora sojae]AEK80595.1 Avh66 [Phytophthora sojae]AEK80596.1 Avh66 [Phytophthora sojae]EGZ29639.1 Avr1b-1 avirulence-like protein [Phytophthora sojae]|eukprot:XP_009516914.1 Avr1b-1 avirulence-like protein [Phytophthora sojae]